MHPVCLPGQDSSAVPDPAALTRILLWSYSDYTMQLFPLNLSWKPGRNVAFFIRTASFSLKEKGLIVPVHSCLLSLAILAAESENFVNDTSWGQSIQRTCPYPEKKEHSINSSASAIFSAFCLDFTKSTD